MKYFCQFFHANLVYIIKYITFVIILYFNIYEERIYTLYNQEYREKEKTDIFLHTLHFYFLCHNPKQYGIEQWHKVQTEQRYQ